MPQGLIWILSQRNSHKVKHAEGPKQQDRPNTARGPGHEVAGKKALTSSFYGDSSFYGNSLFYRHIPYSTEMYHTLRKYILLYGNS